MPNFVSGCPYPCKCITLPTDDMVDCNSLALSSIPSNIPEDTTALTLRDNNIDSLIVLAAQNLPHLEVLDVSQNKISFVHKDAFAVMPKLELVYLSNNNLTSFDSNDFSTMKNLFRAFL